MEILHGGMPPLTVFATGLPAFEWIAALMLIGCHGVSRLAQRPTAQVVKDIIPQYLRWWPR
jgi:hypothetical protein